MGKAAARRPVVRQKGSAVAELGGAEPEAVQRMREANRAAERADDEKFALMDAVDAKLVAWKGSKSDNLRALLGSLDKLLWPEAGYAISFHFHVFSSLLRLLLSPNFCTIYGNVALSDGLKLGDRRAES